MTGTAKRTTHRADTGRYYNGLGIHAAPGVHEYAAYLCQQLLPRGGRVLEVGSGSGALASRLRDLGFDVLPTDLEPEYEWIYRLDLENPEEVGKVAGPFDLVVCVETLEHVENPRAVLRAIRSLMSPEGKLLLSTPNVNHPHSRLKAFLRGNPVMFGAAEYYTTGHITLLPDWLLAEHLTAAGFTAISMTRAGGFDYETRARWMLYHAEMSLLRAIGLQADAARDQGSVLFATARIERLRTGPGLDGVD